MLLLLLNAFSSFAQNTGAGPYRNSWHTYRVIVGNAGNPREWDITDGATITRTLTGAEAWCDIAALAGGNADISICFADSVFASSDGPWYLRYREISVSTGACVAARQFTINLTVNDFYLTLDADHQDCKPESGQVFRWEQLYEVAFQCRDTFKITMHKEAGLDINHWAFDALITLISLPPPTNHIIVGYTGIMDTPGGGSVTITDDGAYGSANDGIFRVQVSDPTPSTLTEVTISIALTLSGYVYEGVTAQLTLSNGITNSGGTGQINTPDNESRPTAGEEPDIALRDRFKEIIFLPLPATPNITVMP